MSELMRRIEALDQAALQPNPKCREPGNCKWDHGLVSCWGCASAALGGSITDIGYGLVATVRVEREPKVAKERSESTGKRNDELRPGTAKWDMYAKAIPKDVRDKLCVEGADLRALYKELRAEGKDTFITKYSK
jgi:hypothetical protein